MSRRADRDWPERKKEAWKPEHPFRVDFADGHSSFPTTFPTAAAARAHLKAAGKPGAVYKWTENASKYGPAWKMYGRAETSTGARQKPRTHKTILGIYSTFREKGGGGVRGWGYRTPDGGGLTNFPTEAEAYHAMVITAKNEEKSVRRMTESARTQKVLKASRARVQPAVAAMGRLARF